LLPINFYDTLPVLTQYSEFRLIDYSLKTADLEFDLRDSATYINQGRINA